MTITTSINSVGLMRATEMVQSARAEAAIEHRAGLHTATMVVSGPSDAGFQAQKDTPILPAPQKRVVDISV